MFYILPRDMSSLWVLRSGAVDGVSPLSTRPEAKIRIAERNTSDLTEGRI